MKSLRIHQHIHHSISEFPSSGPIVNLSQQLQLMIQDTPNNQHSSRYIYIYIYISGNALFLLLVQEANKCK